VTSALYAGLVTHRRRRPRRHSLRYRVLQGLFDLDELPGLERRLRLFGHNRAAPFSFHDRDHGDGSGDLRGWVGRQLEAAGLSGPWGGVQVLCMPRVLGYVFNPLSVYFCRDRTGALAAIVYEVNNTFGERHAYVLPAQAGEAVVRQHCQKAFYVSPFMPMELCYDFRITPPGAGVVVAVSAGDAEGPVLDACFAGQRRPFTDAALLAALATYPAMTLKVIVAIHWEALKLWVGGLRLIPRRRPIVA
jgi:DUF1365 family protein